MIKAQYVAKLDQFPNALNNPRDPQFKFMLSMAALFLWSSASMDPCGDRSTDGRDLIGISV